MTKLDVGDQVRVEGILETFLVLRVDEFASVADLITLKGPELVRWAVPLVSIKPDDGESAPKNVQTSGAIAP
jgi:hypothetical protein